MNMRKRKWNYKREKGIIKKTEPHYLETFMNQNNFISSKILFY
jgi:hypothetical protein